VKDEEILALAESHEISYNADYGRWEYPFQEGYDMRKDLLSYSRALIALCAIPTIEPVPVAERLPGPEDCDAEGRCFVWDWLATEWRFLERDIFDYGWQDAYWLPHHALPVPPYPTLSPEED
jgi:hypothetical protein